MAGYGSDKGERKKREKSQEGPLISVIIPAYNCADTIEKALDSALAQKVPLEVIVVDDGSGDGLDRVMAGYADHPAIRYLKNEKNMGAAASRNRGVAEAKGVYTAFWTRMTGGRRANWKSSLPCWKGQGQYSVPQPESW